MRRITAFALVVPLLLVAACSGGDGETADQPAAAPGAAATASPAASSSDDDSGATGAAAAATASPTAVAEAAAAATETAATPQAQAQAGAPSTPTPASATVAPPAAAAPSVVPERELVGLQSWINSEPLTIAGLVSQGRVVLVDFWTYTCINCIRTMPFLRSWHEKYADRGLTILGIHAPEFDFERELDNVIAAVERFGLEYPVAQDNEMVTWRAFENRVWPAKYLIGSDGKLRYRSLGEGAYVQTEQAIRQALADAGHDVSDIPLGRTDSQARDPDATAQTRELYGGYRWNYAFAPAGFAAQDQYYLGPDRTVLYEDRDVHRDNKWYLQGLWRNEREAIAHARVTDGLEDYIAFKFAARSVNVVLRPHGGQPFDVVIELDGRPLAAGETGSDVVFDGDGRSVIRVDDPRLYAIVELPAFGEHELKLRSNSDDFAIFAFTFGVYADGP